MDLRPPYLAALLLIAVVATSRCGSNPPVVDAGHASPRDASTSCVAPDSGWRVGEVFVVGEVLRAWQIQVDVDGDELLVTRPTSAGYVTERFSPDGQRLGVTKHAVDGFAGPGAVSVETSAGFTVAAFAVASSDAGLDTIVAAGLSRDGGLLFPPGDGGLRSRLETRGADGIGGGVPLVSNDGSCAMVWWPDMCHGWVVRAMSLSRAGDVLSGARTLQTALGGPLCGIAGFVSYVPRGPAGFADIFGELRADGGELVLRARRYDCGLEPAGLETYTVRAAPAADTYSLWYGLPFKRWPSQQSELWVMRSSFGAPRGPLYAWPLADGSEPTPIVPDTFDAQIYGVTLGDTSRGMTVAWQQRHADGGVRTLVRNLASGDIADVSVGGESSAGLAHSIKQVRDRLFVAGDVVATDAGFQGRVHYFCSP